MIFRHGPIADQQKLSVFLCGGAVWVGALRDIHTSPCYLEIVHESDKISLHFMGHIVVSSNLSYIFHNTELGMTLAFIEEHT